LPVPGIAVIWEPLSNTSRKDHLEHCLGNGWQLWKTFH